MLSNIRFSNSGNIVADHTYGENPGTGTARRVEKVKVIAKPNLDGTYRFVSTSEKGREMAVQFAANNNIQIN